MLSRMHQSVLSYIFCMRCLKLIVDCVNNVKYSHWGVLLLIYSSLFQQWTCMFYSNYIFLDFPNSSRIWLISDSQPSCRHFVDMSLNCHELVLTGLSRHLSQNCFELIPNFILDFNLIQVHAKFVSETCFRLVSYVNFLISLRLILDLSWASSRLISALYVSENFRKFYLGLFLYTYFGPKFAPNPKFVLDDAPQLFKILLIRLSTEKIYILSYRY